MLEKCESFLVDLTLTKIMFEIQILVQVNVSRAIQYPRELHWILNTDGSFTWYQIPTSASRGTRYRQNYHVALSVISVKYLYDVLHFLWNENRLFWGF